MKIRIVLLPERKFEEDAKNFSKLIADKVPVLFSLDNNHLPHVTITAQEFEEEHFERVLNLVKEMANIKRLKIGVSEAKIDEETFIGVYFENDNEIKKLRKNFIDLLSKYNKEEIVLRQPHLTLTRVESNENALVALKLAQNFPKHEYYLTTLAICENGNNGTCKRSIRKFDLL